MRCILTHICALLSSSSLAGARGAIALNLSEFQSMIVDSRICDLVPPPRARNVDRNICSLEFQKSVNDWKDKYVHGERLGYGLNDGSC